MPEATQHKAHDTVRNKKGAAAASTQFHMNIAEIKDGIVILKNGGMRAVLQTNSINFNLKSEEEQNAIIYSYQSFLNSLDFPVQIVVSSRKLDVDKYIENVREIGKKNENKLMQEQTYEYCEYIQKLVEYADIMEKKFYVVIPFDPYRITKLSMIQKFMQHISAEDSVEKIKQRHNEFEQLKEKLMERVSVARIGLEGCNLKIEQLNTPQLIELYYQMYNPETSRNAKLTDLSKINVDEL